MGGASVASLRELDDGPSIGEDSDRAESERSDESESLDSVRWVDRSPGVRPLVGLRLSDDERMSELVDSADAGRWAADEDDRRPRLAKLPRPRIMPPALPLLLPPMRLEVDRRGGRPRESSSSSKTADSHASSSARSWRLDRSVWNARSAATTSR